MIKIQENQYKAFFDDMQMMLEGIANVYRNNGYNGRLIVRCQDNDLINMAIALCIVRAFSKVAKLHGTDKTIIEFEFHKIENKNEPLLTRDGRLEAYKQFTRMMELTYVQRRVHPIVTPVSQFTGLSEEEICAMVESKSKEYAAKIAANLNTPDDFKSNSQLIIEAVLLNKVIEDSGSLSRFVFFNKWDSLLNAFERDINANKDINLLPRIAGMYRYNLQNLLQQTNKQLKSENLNSARLEIIRQDLDTGLEQILEQIAGIPDRTWSGYFCEKVTNLQKQLYHLFVQFINLFKAEKDTYQPVYRDSQQAKTTFFKTVEGAKANVLQEIDTMHSKVLAMGQ